MKKSNLSALVEGAAMIALAVVLSLIPLVNMPFGGSITACSMLPIILFSFRRNIKWGLISALVYSVLQMLLGFNNLRYGTSFAAVMAIVFLDYIFAFLVLGLAGIFKNKIKNQSLAISIGTLFGCFLRFICHFISGCTVWAGVSIPSSDGMIYSLAYNAAYMIPETIITTAAAWYLTQILDFRGVKITPNRNKESQGGLICKGIAILLFMSALVFDVIYLFAQIQTEEGYDFAGLSQANSLVFVGIPILGLVLGCIFLLFSRKKQINK